MRSQGCTVLGSTCACLLQPLCLLQADSESDLHAGSCQLCRVPSTDGCWCRSSKPELGQTCSWPHSSDALDSTLSQSKLAGTQRQIAACPEPEPVYCPALARHAQGSCCIIRWSCWAGTKMCGGRYGLVMGALKVAWMQQSFTAQGGVGWWGWAWYKRPGRTAAPGPSRAKIEQSSCQ